MNKQDYDTETAQEKKLPHELRSLEEVLNQPDQSIKLVVPQEAFARMHGYEDE